MYGEVVGIDIGYGFVKSFDGQNEIVFPSVVGIGRDISYSSQLSTYKSPLDTLALSYNGKNHFIGNYAIRQSSIPSRSLDIKKPEDINTLLLFLTALGLFSTNGHQQFSVVTGLPTNYILSYQDQLKSLLSGDHHISLQLRGKSEEKHLTVTDMKIVPQPFGTLFNLVLDSNGEIADENMSGKIIGIADIGFKTADFVVSDSLEFVDRLSSSSGSGMVSAYEIIAAMIRNRYKIDKKDYELDQIVKDKTIKIAGVNHDISDIVSEAYYNLAAKIKTELDSLWDYRELDAIILTGGGGEALSEYLIPKFNNMMLVQDAQFANVKGFLKLAKNKDR
jgi:plasmid segregation protein ParM